VTNLHITHYWALHIPKTDRWQVLQKARDVFGTNYSISGGANGLRVITADEATHVNRTGKLPAAAARPGLEGE